MSGNTSYIISISPHTLSFDDISKFVPMNSVTNARVRLDPIEFKPENISMYFFS